MRFFAKYVDGSTQEIKNITSYEISFSVSVPCSSARVFYSSKNSLKEMVELTIFNSNEKIFFGFVDKESVTTSNNGSNHFIYARSSASLLVDNEASPITYESPSVSGLFYINAKPFGFKNLLPEFTSNDFFEISKGQSCFSVIQNFMSVFSNYSIYVNANNELKVFEKGNKAKFIDENTVLKIKSTINRGNPISFLDYKISSNENYNHHMKSLFLENRRINRKRNLNLSGTSQWQRNHKAQSKIENSVKSYYKIELTLTNDNSLKLNDLVKLNSEVFENFKSFYVEEITYLNDLKGKRCLVSLEPKIDLEEQNYVDK